MKKKHAKLLCSFIPVKKWRKKAKAHLSDAPPSNQDLLDRLDALEKSLNYDINLIFKYMTRGIELHPSYSLERLVVSGYKEILHNEALPVWYREHMTRYLFAKEYINEGDTLIDIACGTGYGSSFLVCESKAASVTGIDISDDAIRFAQRLFRNPNLRYRQGSALDINLLKANSLDALISFETIEHVPESEADEALKNYFHWLKPSGTLLISVPNEDGGPLFRDGVQTNPHHYKHYTIDEIKAKISMCGFKNIQIFSQISAKEIIKEEDSSAEYLVVTAQK